MTNTFSTGNPLGSTDPRDASDNASNFDEFVNGTNTTFSDRFGVERKTVTGALQAYAAYNQRGTWTTATAYNVNDVWRDGPSGAFYLVLADYTSGATAAADIAGGNVVVHQPKDWVVSVATIADLRALEPAFDGQQVELLGHTVAGIGGGTFYADYSSSVVDDNGVTVVTAGGNRWVRRLDGDITPQMFGAIGDGVNDDSNAVQAVFEYLSEAGVVDFPEGVFRVSGVISSKTISMRGRGAGVTTLINATPGATMFSYNQVGMNDKERRNWLNIEGMTIRDEASFTGTGIKTDGVLSVILRDVYLRDFKTGFGLQCLETLWAYLDMVHSDMSEIQFRSTSVPHNNNVVCIRGGELRNPPAGKFGLFVENGDIVRLIDSTIEGVNGGAMTAGGKFKSVKMLSLENTYFEVLSTATEGGLSLEGCQAVNISGSQLNSQSTTVPSLILNGCDNVKLGRSVMVAFPIRTIGVNSVEMDGCMMEGPQDISANTTLKVRSPIPYNTRSAIVTDPRYQPRNSGLPRAFRNTYSDSSFETAAPTTTVVAGAPVSSLDTTQGYYDSNSWRVTGVNGDVIRSATLGTTSSAGKSGCLSFMAKADTAGRFILTMFLDGSAGGQHIYLSTEWRRYFVVTNLRPESASGAPFLLQLGFTDTNAFNIDDVQFVDFTDYGEIPGIIDGFNYLPTHGSTIPGAVSRTMFPEKVWLDRGLNLRSLPVYADNTAAGAGGLVAGDVYRTSTGTLAVRY